MSTIRNYIPESFFLEKKDRDHMRVCREDVVLIDPANNFCVVAGRGKEIREGEPYTPLDRLPKSEWNFLKQSLGKGNRLLVQGKNQAILVFGDLLSATGLLLIVCPHFDAVALRRGLLLLQRTDFVCSPALENGTPSPQQSDASVCEYLQSIFYDLDRILSPSHKIGIWTRAALIANFAGCPSEFRSLPVEDIPLAPSEKLRLSAFLLCLYLSIRAEALRACAEGEDSLSSISLNVSLYEPQDATKAEGDYPFLSLPAFRGISLHRQSYGWLLEASFQKESDSLVFHSASSSLVGIRIAFHYAS